MLRTSSRRGSWVQIPPPAPICTLTRRWEYVVVLEDRRLIESANTIVRTRDLNGTLPKTRSELEKRILEVERSGVFSRKVSGEVPDEALVGVRMMMSYT